MLVWKSTYFMYYNAYPAIYYCIIVRYLGNVGYVSLLTFSFTQKCVQLREGGGIARPLLTSFYTYSWLWQRISNTLPAYLFNTLNKYSVIQISKQSYDQFISNSNSYVKFVIACNKNVWLFFHYRCMINVFLLTWIYWQ